MFKCALVMWNGLLLPSLIWLCIVRSMTLQNEANLPAVFISAINVRASFR